MGLLVPFSEKVQLCHELSETMDGPLRRLASSSPAEPWLPGFPAISLDAKAVEACLERELLTPKLNKMHGWLWLVATQSSSHVSSLTEQIVRGRDIIITEDAELHLVWIHNRVFIKPLPSFLCSYHLWNLHLSGDDASKGLREAALGYVRTYQYLIRYESDFRLAKEKHLVPEGVGFTQFMTFITAFASNNVLDTDVSPRYTYGQLRLTRLNLWAKFALGQWVFHKVQWQYADIFAQFYAPIILAFGFLSVVLAAMQVGSQARPEWGEFASVSAWFSVACLLTVVIVALGLVLLLIFLMSNEFTFAMKAKRKAKREKEKSEVTRNKV
ncbi:hypothetical protein B0I35DRAFT_446648 [Stachybotrys elegans]|uniref:Subtilisin-like serine protease n=1 Tax=Stachybotrys elegans TaxID=80388 RepID=A0A8K0SDT0_9HYPO|nr:hypothetical protein B0I35DRAFT_446648 [Stachybotrys elegans]